MIVGGYDRRVEENVAYVQELSVLGKSLKLKSHIWKQGIDTPADTQILFILGFSDVQRTYLLAKSACLLYTPSFEHFGIVPLEAMYSKLPVVAVNRGGPMETIVDKVTGFLCEPTPESFSIPIMGLLKDRDRKIQFGKAGREHVLSSFSLDLFTGKLEEIVKETLNSSNLDAALIFYTLGAFISMASLILVLAFVINI